MSCACCCVSIVLLSQICNTLCQRYNTPCQRLNGHQHCKDCLSEQHTFKLSQCLLQPHTCMKWTPLWYADAANPHMSPMTPPPRATNVELRSSLLCNALSQTCCSTSRLLNCSPSGSVTTWISCLPPELRALVHLQGRFKFADAHQ